MNYLVVGMLVLMVGGELVGQGSTVLGMQRASAIIESFGKRPRTSTTVAVDIGYYVNVDNLRSEAVDHLRKIEGQARADLYTYDLDEIGNRMRLYAKRLDLLYDIVDDIFESVDMWVQTDAIKLDFSYASDARKKQLFDEALFDIRSQVKSLVGQIRSPRDLIALR